MTLRQEKEGKKLVLYIEGRVDTDTSPELLELLQKEMPDIDELVLDFKDVEYISSAGLRVVLFAQKTMNSQGSMVVRNVCKEVMEIFELTCFTDILTII